MSKYYYLVEEASGATEGTYEHLAEAVEDAMSLGGKHLVVDEEDNVLFDSQPGVTYKI